MIDINFSQLEQWISLFLWPFARVTGLLIAAPIFSHRSFPMRAKIVFGVALTALISNSVALPQNVAILSWASVGILIEQILIGVAIGMVMQVLFAVVQAAGDFIGLQMGLAFAAFFSADTGANTMILARFLFIVSMLFFLAIDGHLMMLQVLSASFDIIPIASFSLKADGFLQIALYGSAVFKLGMLLALPVIGVLLVINLSMGILNRSAPQFTVFSVGFPISLTVGALLFALLMTQLGQFLNGLFQQGFSTLLLILREGLAG